MKRTWLPYLLPATAFAVLVGFFIARLGEDPSRIPSPLVGKPAPQFALESLASPEWTVATAGFAGRPWVLNVWATWCPPCREEHGSLLAIARENRAPIVGLNWKDDRQLALRWLAQLGNPYTAVAYDPEGRAAIDWGVTGAPETFLIGADGSVLWKHAGPLTPEIWRRDFLPRIEDSGAGEG